MLCGATVLIIIIVVSAIGGTVMNGLQHPKGMLSTPTAFSTATPKELFAETVRQTQDTIDVAGGHWYYNNGVNRTNDHGAPWSNPPATESYSAGSCGASELFQYTMTVYGDPITDPDGASAAMRAHWEKLGYQMNQLGPEKADATHNQELNARLPNGAMLTYAVATNLGAIIVRSACVPHTSDEMYQAAP